MPLHLLRDIPREVRDQIYAHVFSSPYGCVSLGRIDPYQYPHWGDGPRIRIVPINPRTYEQMNMEPAIKLSLLRTCSQVHLEARNVLWRHNCLAIAKATTLYAHSRFLDPKFCYSIQRVQLKMDLMLNRTSAAELGSALRIFGNWARQGSLRSLTLTMFMGPQRAMSALNDLAQMHANFPDLFVSATHSIGSPVETFFENLAKLKEAGETLPMQLKRGIVFDTDWDVLPLVAKRDWLRRRENFNPAAAIREIHDRFGGEFWMDGELLFKDHLEVERVFDLPPDNERSRPTGR